MDFSKFGGNIQAKARQLENYFNDGGNKAVIKEVTRFLDDNFRLQGWQGTSLEPWRANKKGTTILVKSGALRRGFNHSVIGAGTVQFYNNVPYAAVHNQGFNGSINITGHTRSKYEKAQKFDVNTRRKQTLTVKIGETNVQSHTRQMNIDQRQFAPYEGHESQILNDEITKQLETDIMNLFKF